MRLRNLQYRTRKRVWLAYLIPRLSWPVSFQVENVTRFWQLTQGNGNGLQRGTERTHRKEKAVAAMWLGRVPREWSPETDF